MAYLHSIYTLRGFTALTQRYLCAYAYYQVGRNDAGIDLLEFRPSEIAAAAVLVSSSEIQAVEVEKALNGCIHLEKVISKLMLLDSLFFLFRLDLSL